MPPIFLPLRPISASSSEDEYDGQKPRIAFIDATGIGGPIVDRMRQLGHRTVVVVQFGGKPPDVHYANMRAWMWAEVKDRLTRGSIDADALAGDGPDGARVSPRPSGSGGTREQGRYEEAGLDSPDAADALALTFAQRVAPLAVDNSLAMFGLFSGGFGEPGDWM